MTNGLVAIVWAMLATSNALPGNWQEDYGVALRYAREHKKPLLVVIDAPGREARFPESSLFEPARLRLTGSSDLLDSYELCHIDASTKYGQRMARLFKAHELPQTTIIDREGRVKLFVKSGQMDDEQWENMLVAFKVGRRAERASQATTICYT